MNDKIIIGITGTIGAGKGTIVDYLIEQYGKDKFQNYMVKLADSWQPEKVFKDVYRIDFNTCLNDFKKNVKEHNH